MLRFGNVEDSVPVAPPQEPPGTTGKLAEDVAGREETTEGPPDELYVEINEGTTSVPEDWEVEPGVPELEDAGYCVEVEAEERGTGVEAMFEFPPLESRREVATEGMIPRELLKLPVLTRWCPAGKQIDLAVKLGC